MSLHLIPSEDLRVSCRQKIEACELWLRRLIHDQFLPVFGQDYINTAQIAGQAIFRTEIRKHVKGRYAASPGRYTRQIDALQLDHLASIVCKFNVYKTYFKDPFKCGFPIGNDHLRLVLDRLVQIRNALAHANTFTIHDAERVFCYCDDVISSLVQHYATIGMTQDFDAPSFTRFSDSVGHVEHPTLTRTSLNFTERRQLRSGESIRFEVEVDAHYAPSEYNIKWQVANLTGGESGEGLGFSLDLQPRHVGMNFSILLTLTSTKEWHRHGNFDAQMVLIYTVLPPP